MTVLLLWVFSVAHAQVSDPWSLSPEGVLARFEHEPSVHQVQRWAAHHVRAEPGRVDAWLQETRRAAALPEVWVRYRHTLDRDRSFDAHAVDGLVDGPTEPMFTALESAGRAGEAQVTVQARWNLQGLATSSERLRMLAVAQDFAELRQEVQLEANALYFERRRLQVRMLLAPKADPLGRAHDSLALRQLGADLDALTGGRFSAALQGGAP